MELPLNRAALHRYGKILTVMEGVKTIITLLGDLATLLRLVLRPQCILAAENPFLCKQLAMFQERKVKHHRPDTPTRCPARTYWATYKWYSAAAAV